MLVGKNRQKNLNYKTFNLYFVVDSQAKVSVAIYLGKSKSYQSNMFYIVMPVQSIYKLNKTQKEFYVNDYYFNTFFPVVFQEMLKRGASEHMLLGNYSYVYEYDFQYDKEALSKWMTKNLVATNIFSNISIEDNMVLDNAKKKASEKKYLSAKEVIPGGIYETGNWDYWYLGKNPKNNKHYYVRLGLNFPKQPYLEWLLKNPGLISMCNNKKKCTVTIARTKHLDVPDGVFEVLENYYEDRFI